MKTGRVSAARTSSLFWEFLPLFHRHFLGVFHERGKLGLTKSQNKALMIILHRETIIPSELGSCLDMTKASLTTLLDALEQAGLVTRRRDNDDRRKCRLKLTEAGKRYTEQRKKMMEQRMEEKLAKLSPAERQEFFGHLGKLVGIMKNF